MKNVRLCETRGEKPRFTLTRRGLVMRATSETRRRMPAVHQNQKTLSLAAMARLAFFLPVFSLHSFSRCWRCPLIDHQIPLRPGDISPLASFELYSVAFFWRSSKERMILSAMAPEERPSCNLYRSVASRGREYPRRRRGLIHSKVRMLSQFALTSGMISASSKEALGGGGLR